MFATGCRYMFVRALTGVVEMNEVRAGVVVTDISALDICVCIEYGGLRIA